VTSSAIIVLLLIGAASPARAHLQAELDDDDVPGRLDIRAAGFDHRGGELRIIIRTWSTWSDRALSSGSLYGFLDLRGGRGIDFALSISRSDVLDRLECLVFNRRNRIVGEGRVTRARRDSASCVVDQDMTGSPDDFVRWAVGSVQRRSGEDISDFAPDVGTFFHEI
jgi:hypothetical protein